MLNNKLINNKLKGSLSISVPFFVIIFLSIFLIISSILQSLMLRNKIENDLEMIALQVVSNNLKNVSSSIKDYYTATYSFDINDFVLSKNEILEYYNNSNEFYNIEKIEIKFLNNNLKSDDVVIYKIIAYINQKFKIFDKVFDIDYKIIKNATFFK